MRLYSRLVLSAGAVALLAAPMQAQHKPGLSLGGSIGANVPNGKFSSETSTGMTANGFLTLQFTDNLGLRGELFWSRSDLDNPIIRQVGNNVLPPQGVGSVDGNVSMIGGIANIVISPFGNGATFIRPYLIGGVGIYQARVVQDVNGAVDAFRNLKESNSSAGVNGGAGVHFSVGRLGAFVEGRYHSVVVPWHRLNFIPVTVGFDF
jgi:hypothetical protein